MTGKADIYHHKYTGWVARAWPRPHRPSPSPRWQASKRLLAGGWEWYRTARGWFADTATAAAQGSAKTTVDYLRSMYMRCPPNEPVAIPATEITYSVTE